MEKQEWQITYAKAQAAFKTYCTLSDKALDWLFLSEKTKDEFDHEIGLLKYKKLKKQSFEYANEYINISQKLYERSNNN
jgi:hypothetical protein